VRGRSWGQTRDSRVWVSRGCRAVFAVRPDHRYDDNRVGDNRYGDNRDSDPRYGDNRNQDPRYQDNQDNRYADQRDGDSWTRDRNYSVDCRADGGGRNSCAWDNRYGTPYVMQRNSGDCVEGRDWGYDREGRIWVDSDCNARFGYHNN
jgi:hypothetical protein